MDFIPVSEPKIAKNALKYVTNCIKSGWVSSAGEYITKFEESFAQYLGVKHAVTTTNGTTALHLALVCLKIQKGDEVIIPNSTNIATALAVVYCQATPIFVDVEPDTGNIDVSKIEEKITPKTKAIIPVHLYGHPVDMDPLMAIAKKHGLFVVEDAAEAHGALYKDKKTGTFGEINCFSFYGNKIVTTGEGGMVVTDDDSLAERARKLKNLSYSQKNRYWHDEIGFNFRMTNLQAALGVAQLEEIDWAINKKRQIAKTYTAQLKKNKSLQLPIEKEYAKNVYWMYIVHLHKSAKISKEQLRAKLLEKGIDTRDFFMPMHLQPALAPFTHQKDDHLPVSEGLAERGFYLPTGLTLKTAQIHYITNTLTSLLS